jgi:oligopeptide transport system substrate-binding protein
VRSRATAALAAAALLLSGACGDDGGDAGTTTTTGPTATTGPDGQVAGGVLRMGLGRIEGALDPALARPDSPTSSVVADLLWDGLTSLEAGEVTAAPAVASSWAASDDVRTWTFELDSDRTFSDGSPVTAAHVELSLERVVSLGSASLTASRLDTVEGYQAFLDAGGRLTEADLTGIEAVDEATVEIRLTRPMASLPELLAAPAYGIVAEPGPVDDGEELLAVAGSGPFRLADRTDDLVSLERAPGREPLLDGVELHLYDDAAAAYADFRAGRLDWSLVPPAEAEAAVAEHGDDHVTPFQAERFYGFNLADDTFADVRFRRAVALAIDAVALAESLVGPVSEPLVGIVPTGVPGADPARCGDACRHDRAAAEALLAEAFPDGDVPTVPVDFPDVAEESAAATALGTALEAVGVPVDLRPHPPAEFSRFAVSGEQGLASLGWVGVQALPEDYVDRLFRTGAPDNLVSFTSSTVDDLLDRAAATLDAAERARLVGEAEAAVLDVVAVVPVAQFVVLAVATPAVRDLRLGVTGTFDAERAWLG